MAGVGAIQGGMNGLSSGGLGSLRSALASVAPPPNPDTPRVRTNVEMAHYITIIQASHFIKRAAEEDDDPQMGELLKSIDGVLQQIIMGRDSASVMQYVQQAVAGGAPSSVTPPGIGAPGAPGGAPGGAPPMGMPPPGGAPGGPAAAAPSPMMAGA